jgi:hypothetical protein
MRFYGWQLAGMALIMLVPLLTLFGLFGTTRASTSASNQEIEMRVQYPTRFRYKMISPLQVAVRSLSSRPLSTVTVQFDRSYIEQFSEVTFTPAVKTVTDESYVVELQDVQPGETRYVSATLQAEEYGGKRGTVTVTAGGDPVQAAVETFVFP